MQTTSFVSMGILAAGLALAAAAENDGWVNLYNGKNLDGWVQRGGKAQYKADGSDLVGTSVPNTANSFLCTARAYTNFILEFEFKVDPRLNSGVQVRSECFDEARKVEWKGKTLSIPAGRVHGYQIEIDPNPKNARWWSAGIYDEGRRAWLYPGQLGGDGKAFTKQGGEIFKQEAWNHVKVEAKGDTLKTWLNGTARAEIKDSMTPAGFIALQVHGVGKQVEPLEIRWRNIRLKELP